MGRLDKYIRSEGLGGIGDYRVVLRETIREGVFVQIMDDSDGVGMGFNLREAKVIVEKLQRGIVLLEEHRAKRLAPTAPLTEGAR